MPRSVKRGNTATRGVSWAQLREQVQAANTPASRARQAQLIQRGEATRRTLLSAVDFWGRGKKLDAAAREKFAQDVDDIIVRSAARLIIAEAAKSPGLHRAGARFKAERSKPKNERRPLKSEDFIQTPAQLPWVGISGPRAYEAPWAWTPSKKQKERAVVADELKKAARAVGKTVGYSYNAVMGHYGGRGPALLVAIWNSVGLVGGSEQTAADLIRRKQTR